MRRLSSSDSGADRIGSTTLEADTLLPGTGTRSKQAFEREPTLTIAYHPEAQRIGEQARLAGDGSLWQAEVSRLTPGFATSGGILTGPLRHPSVSRQPLTILVTTHNVRIVSQQPVTVDGRSTTGSIEVPSELLHLGIVIELAGGVILVLKLQLPTTPARFNLLGLSDAIALLRNEIEHIGPQDASVLIQGETGVGKELVARALHHRSRRAEHPFVAVNMGAIPKDTAVAELFGYKKGSFTGTVSDHGGYFGMADGGTLFLDEIGETPLEVQPILLRALENKEIQPLGTARAKSIDVRVIAATDANLKSLEESGKFRSALLHRLNGYQLKVAPLRERKEDIAPLFLNFLRQELTRTGNDARLLPQQGESWLRSRVIAQLLRHSWPGNVRELHNVASQVAAFSGRSSRSEFPPALSMDGISSSTDPPTSTARPEDQEYQKGRGAEPTSRGSERPSRPSEISDERLLAALQHNAWRIAATARDLGIAKNSLYELIDRCPKIRKARDIDKDEIAQAHVRCNGDIEAAASELQVSLRALQLRMGELGMK